jgi:hypothetical protein
VNGEMGRIRKEAAAFSRSYASICLEELSEVTEGFRRDIRIDPGWSDRNLF